MHIITVKRLKDFWQIHPDTEQPLRAWYHHCKCACWKTPGDIKSEFASVSFLANNRVVFNIKGNTYRWVCF